MPVFAEVTSHLGGEYHPEADPDLAGVVNWSTNRLHQLQNANYVSAGEPIRFGLVNSYDFNAFAAVCRGTDVVGVNLGLIFVLDNLVMLMMSHPEILPEIGDAETETTPPTIKFTRDWAALSSRSRLRIPSDAVRFDYAQNVAWIARNFMLEHEFCHLFNGHVDWLKERHQLNALSEIGASSIRELSNLNLQTLEMDADCYAATHTLLGLFRSDPAKVFGGQRPGLLSGAPNPFLCSFDQILFAVQLAIYCVFRLFHNRPVDLTRSLLHRSDHPPAILRQFITGATLHSRMNDNPDVFNRISLDTFNAGATRAISSAEKAFLLITGLKPTGPPTPTYWEDVVRACRAAGDELRKNWQSLRDELERHKRGNSLAE